MLKHYANLGVPLTREEMKEVKGGASAFAAILWECYIDDNIHFNMCRTSDPTIPCGYAECVPIDTCTPITPICI